MIGLSARVRVLASDPGFVGSQSPKGDRYRDGVAMLFLTASNLGYGEQRAFLLVAPHARLPRVPVHDGVHRRASPAVRHRWRVLLGERDEVPATRSWIAPQLGAELHREIHLGVSSPPSAPYSSTDTAARTDTSPRRAEGTAARAA